MSDFPSLADLTKAQGTQPALSGVKPGSAARSGGLAVASDAVQEKFTKKMAQVAVKQKEVETMRLAAGLGLPHIDLEQFPVAQAALQILPREKAETAQAVCFFYSQEQFRLGALDPNRSEVQSLLKDLEEETGAKGALYVISRKSLEQVLEMYNRLPVAKSITKDIAIAESDLERVKADVKDFSQLQAMLRKTTATDLMTFLLGAALNLNASDLHIEAEEGGIHVRLRLDGILHDAAQLEKEIFKKLVARIKLVSSLKINITDRPQDGRFTIKLSGGDVDIRVSTLPTYYGESIVMRLLPQKREGLTLESLGFLGEAYTRLKREIERPNGMIVTTGPTGSGKTTTLYSIMQILNKPGVKIITLEDPVEYRMAGINQSQVDKSRNYTFAAGLRSILRQDPDICMVGEIRDLETAEIAIQAALTGHLMLSTIHTNSAAGAIPRFLSMGIKPFLLAPATNAIMGQRLVRRLAPDNKVPATLTAEQSERVEQIIAGLPESARLEAAAKPRQFFTAGVDGPDGYKGRVGIYEILTMSPELEQMILSGQVSEFEIEKLAVSQGMVTMVQDGILKALDGITSVDEVFRVIE